MEMVKVRTAIHGRNIWMPRLILKTKIKNIRLVLPNESVCGAKFQKFRLAVYKPVEAFPYVEKASDDAHTPPDSPRNMTWFISFISTIAAIVLGLAGVAVAILAANRSAATARALSPTVPATVLPSQATYHSHSHLYHQFSPVLASLTCHRPPALATISLRPRTLLQQTEALGEWLAWVNYKVMQALMWPAWGKLLTVLTVAVPILALGSAALCQMTGLNLRAALFRCYLILNNVPGTDIASEENPRAAVVLNLVHTVGLLTFATLIGVIGEDIGRAVDVAKLGNSRVVERDHTLVLGYNRQLVEIIRQVAHVRTDRGAAAFPGPLVVLSEVPRSELESSLAEALGPSVAAAVVTRQGSPLQVADLLRVSAGSARTVILLAPEGTSGQEDAGGDVAGGDVDVGACPGLSTEARQSVTLAALAHLRRQALQGPGGNYSNSQPQTVIIQHDSADLELLNPEAFSSGSRGWGRGVGGGGGSGAVAANRHLSPQATPVSHLNSLARIQAQCAAQPGLSAVLGSLLQQQTGLPEFYIHPVPEVVGLTYGQARRLFPRAVLCGLYDVNAALPVDAAPSTKSRLDAAVVLNPPDSTILMEQYALIFLADCLTHLRVDSARLQELLRSALRDPQRPQQHGTCNNAASDLEPPGLWNRLRNIRSSSSAVAAPSGSLAATSGGQQLRDREPVAPGRTTTRAESGAAPLRVVVLSFSAATQATEELLEALSDYCPPGSHAVVVTASRGSSDIQHLRKPWLRRLRVSSVIGDPRTRASLLEAGAEDADAVILTGLQAVKAHQADAQALATLLQLQTLLMTQQPGGTGARSPLNLVCAVTDPRVREVMSGIVQVQSENHQTRRGLIVEAVKPDELLAGVLTQVAAEPRLGGLFHELLSSEGVEVRLHMPVALGLPYSQPLTWDQVQDTGRERGVTVIGLLHAAYSSFEEGKGAAPSMQLMLGPPLKSQAAVLELQPGDKVIVLSGG